MVFRPPPFWFGLLALCSLFVGKAMPQEHVSSPLYIDLSRAYGYYNGQKLSLERIQREFPALAAEAKKAQMEFDLAFKSSYESIERELRNLFGEKWNEYKNRLRDQITQTLTSRQS
jgi:hypothetical protein